MLNIREQFRYALLCLISCVYVLTLYIFEPKSNLDSNNCLNKRIYYHLQTLRIWRAFVALALVDLYENVSPYFIVLKCITSFTFGKRKMYKVPWLLSTCFTLNNCRFYVYHSKTQK